MMKIITSTLKIASIGMLTALATTTFLACEALSPESGKENLDTLIMLDTLRILETNIDTLVVINKDTTVIKSNDTTYMVSSDTLYVYDTTFNYDTVLSYDTVHHYETIYQIDTVVIDNGDNGYTPPPHSRQDTTYEDTASFENVNMGTELVLQSWKLYSKILPDGTRETNLRGVIKNTTQDTVKNVRIALRFYYEGVTLFTIKARVFFPQYISDYNMWNKISPNWWGEFDLERKPLEQNGLTTSTDCAFYNEASGTNFTLSKDCKFQDLDYFSLIKQNVISVDVSYTKDGD